MNLLLIPVLLIAGVALVYMGINGTPQLQLQSLPLPRLLPSQILHIHFREAVRGRPGRASADLTAALPTITQSDVLLADVLTEMLDLKAQFVQLQDQIAKLSEEVHGVQPEAAHETPARTRVRRRVA